MKNIPALMFLVIIFFIITAKNHIFTQENLNNNDDTAETANTQTNKEQKNFHISIGPLYGIMYGQTRELVYPVDTRGDLLSELRWDMKPIHYFGLQLELEYLNSLKRWGLFTDISFSFGIPGDTGIMEDRDWQSVENAGLTNYSRHTNRTNEFYWLDAKAGFLFPIHSRFYINPFLSFSWMRFSFTGRDGEGKYARGYNGIYYPIDDEPDIYPFSGNLINYTQNWFIAAAGFIAGAKITPNFNIDLSIQITPLTFCSAVDEHLLSGVTFYDYTYFGLFVEPALNMSLNIKMIELNLNFNYRYIGSTRGISYKLQSEIYSEAGAGLSLFNACFAVKIRFK